AAARRRALASRVLEVFEAWGYSRIVTPMFEVADVLERGLGHDARAQAIRFVEPGTGEIVALRPDITPQIARVVATRLSEVQGPIRLCYEGAVTRFVGERGQREILQAGVELIDEQEPIGDVEVLSVAHAALAATGLSETRLDIGHVAPVRALLGLAPDTDARAHLAAAFAKKDRAGVRVAAKSLPANIAPFAEQLVTMWGPAEETIRRAEQLSWPSELVDVRTTLGVLGSVLVRFTDLTGAPASTLSIDLGDVRGFDYYTGITFAGYAGGAPEAVLRGGRYDQLIGRYGRPARATGFAIDLEALAQAQRTTGVQLPSGPVGVAVHGPGAASLARALRSHGVRAVTSVDAPTAAWLRGAGLDAAVLTDSRELVRVDDVRRAVDLDPSALAKLLEENRCLS
ncbi:MAG: ATP phosphoribosyltransferase regulatory subunit, partial [Kofleriaceae bacterium]